eukprot:scaffold12828_cov112-Isochrysis_galbana.AAC.5
MAASTSLCGPVAVGLSPASTSTDHCSCFEATADATAASFSSQAVRRTPPTPTSAVLSVRAGEPCDKRRSRETRARSSRARSMEESKSAIMCGAGARPTRAATARALALVSGGSCVWNAGGGMRMTGAGASSSEFFGRSAPLYAAARASMAC